MDYHNIHGHDLINNRDLLDDFLQENIHDIYKFRYFIIYPDY